MTSLSEILGFGGQAQQPPDEALDMVQKARRSEEFKKQFGAEPAAYSGLGNFLERAPQAFLGLGPPMSSTQTLPIVRTAGGGEDVEAVKALQRDLKVKGYYKGPIDGKMEGGTSAAKKEFDAAEQVRRQQENEGAKTGADTARANAEAARAKAEADRIAFDTAEAQRKIESRKEGDTKLKQAEDSLPWHSRFFRDNGQPLGIAAGTLAALLMRGGLPVPGFRGGMIGKYNAQQVETEQAAKSLMSQAPSSGTPVSASNVGDRAGRVNDFYKMGGASKQPFENDATSVRGLKSNADAPQSSELYLPPSRASTYAKDAIIPAVGGIDYVGAHWMKGGAQDKLDKATESYNKEPSQANLDALQKAKESVAMYEGAETIGRTVGTLGLAGMLKNGRIEKRPQMGIADSERAMVDAYLKKAGTQPLAPAPLPALAPIVQPQPVAAAPKPVGGTHPDHNWNAKAGRWQDVDGSFLAGPPPPTP